VPIILTFFVWVNPVLLNAQRIDSLKRVIEDAHGAMLCSIYYQVGYELLDTDFKGALEYANKALGCSVTIQDTLNLLRSAQLKAMAFRRLEDIDSSNVLITKVLPLARNRKYFSELHDLLHGLALGLLYKAEFDQSLRYNFEALELREVYGTAFQVGSTLFNIGFVYYKLGDYSKALEYFTRSLEQLGKEPRDGKLIVKVFVNMALSHAYSGDGRKAEIHMAEVLRRCDGNCASEDLQNIAFCRGIVYLGRADTAAAKVQFFESYTRAVADGHERIQLDNIIYLSRIYLGAEDTQEAANYLGMAEKLILRGVPYNMELMKVYSEFAALYERKGDYKKVSHFLRRHMALKDSIYDDEVTTSLMRIEAAHVEKEKNAKIETQNKLLELNNKVIARQRIATILAVTTAAFLTGFVVMLVRNIREKKMRNADLEQRVKNRTAELEAMVYQSKIWVNEKKQWVEKMVCSVKHSTNSIAGLVSLSRRDPASNEEYIKLIDHEVKHLLTQVSGYAVKSEEQVKDFRSST